MFGEKSITQSLASSRTKLRTFHCKILFEGSKRAFSVFQIPNMHHFFIIKREHLKLLSKGRKVLYMAKAKLQKKIDAAIFEGGNSMTYPSQRNKTKETHR